MVIAKNWTNVIRILLKPGRMLSGFRPNPEWFVIQISDWFVIRILERFVIRIYAKTRMFVVCILVKTRMDSLFIFWLKPGWVYCPDVWFKTQLKVPLGFEYSWKVRWVLNGVFYFWRLNENLMEKDSSYWNYVKFHCFA